MAAASSLEAVRDALAERRNAGEPASVEAIVAASGAAAGAADATLAAPRLQPDRHRAAHQSRPRAVARRGGRRRPPRRCATPSTLEYDLDSGRRGERDDHVAGWLTRLTGAEAALAVNNNAGALLLALNALAAGARDDRLARRTDRDRRLVPPARHHGSAPAPGCARSAPPTAPISRDFAAAIGPDTGADPQGAHQQLRRSRASPRRCRRRGSPSSRSEHGLPFVEDLGSGTLVDLERWGLPHEPTVARSAQAPAPISSPSAATSCWADRRPGSSSAAPIWSPRWRRTR